MKVLAADHVPSQKTAYVKMSLNRISSPTLNAPLSWSAVTDSTLGLEDDWVSIVIAFSGISIGNPGVSVAI